MSRYILKAMCWPMRMGWNCGRVIRAVAHAIHEIPRSDTLLQSSVTLLLSEPLSPAGVAIQTDRFNLACTPAAVHGGAQHAQLRVAW